MKNNKENSDVENNLSIIKTSEKQGGEDDKSEIESDETSFLSILKDALIFYLRIFFIWIFVIAPLMLIAEYFSPERIFGEEKASPDQLL